MKKLILILFLFSGFILNGQVPEGYYNGTENLGGAGLKTALYNIIKGHTQFPYSSNSTYPGTDVWDILKQSDKDPNNAANVQLFYCGRSIDAAQEWNSGNGWEREHVWAKSRGSLTTTDPGPGTDAHNLKPADGDVNGMRNNRWFAETNEIEYLDNGFATGCYYSTTKWIWKPKDNMKGDAARIIFYMATRYEGENGEPNLEVIDFLPTEQNTILPQHALLSDLLRWNAEDPVDEFERNRNNVIFTYQKNRNPFIDHPEWVECIWNNNCSGFWFTSTPNKKLTDRQSYSYNISASGGNAQLTITGETVPAWLTFTAGTSATGNASASLSGEPAFSDIGKHSVSIKLSDGTTSIYQNFEIEVIDGNPIKFTSTPVTKINAGQLYSYSITATGDEGAVFYISATKPEWLTLSSSTLPATLSGTPSMSNLGKASVVLTLTDDAGKKKTITQEFEILISDPNQKNNIIITQYYEGNTEESTTDGSDKYIEITNIGTQAVDLSSYYLGRWGSTSTPTGNYANGGVLTGTIEAGQTLVYKNSKAVAPAYAVSNAVASTEATFVNGDDPVALTLNGITWEDRVDCIYSTGVWGAAKCFYRKANVTQGNTAISVLNGTGEWVETSLASVHSASSKMPEYLGFHGEASQGVENVKQTFSIYPNPAHDQIVIESTNEIERIEILSITGQLLLQQTESNTKISVSISELQEGIYFVKVTEKTGYTELQKFIKN